MSLPPQTDKTVKHRPAPMKDTVHQPEVYYGLGPSAVDPGLSNMSAGTSGLYNTEKVPQNLGQYHQQPNQVKWMHQDMSMQGTDWAHETQGPGWGQNFAPYMGGVNVRGFHKGIHEGLSMSAENQMQDVFRDNTQWDQIHQLQSYQPPQQQQTQMQAPMLQSFQTFRQSKPQEPQFNPGYYTGFAQKQAPMQSLGYAEQPKQQQPLLMHQIQQQQQIHHQQQLQMQPHHQQQRQMQTQYHQQHMQPTVPMSHQTMQQDMLVTPKVNFVSYEHQSKVEESVKLEQQNVPLKEMVLDKAAQAEGALNTVPAAQPRRSRRHSREGQSPSTEQPQNGVAAMGQRAGDVQGGTGGVIHSTQRRRRASKEINLETLAQQAAKRESLPAKVKEEAPSGRQSSMAPLVMPVSVPVPRAQQQGPPEGRHRTSDRCGGQSLPKPSVIVARRRSLRNSVNERTAQDGDNDSGTDDEGRSRPKRRPRPEPLIIPPPRPSSFIPPSLYSSITPYQSHLRSPVNPVEHPVMLPPYTPPPILSPVRAGSGLYFSTFLSNMATAGTQVPPSVTTKPVTVSLLRLPSSEITPPLTVVTDATPVSLEPRINIGQQYQAEIPDLQSRSSSQLDQHPADLLWLPLEIQHGGQDTMRDLMNLACSSVLNGGGTNQELVLHCLFQSRGDVLGTLEHLMLQDALFPKDHALSDYHYSGSDSWTPEEKRYFNKGISAYRKDFIMVQKLVQTKSVAQCVEFYYTYKKQVKVGRSGTLTFGPADSALQSQEEVIDNKSSQQPTVAPMNEGEFNHQPPEEREESRHQARVAQSLQAHDYAAVTVSSQPSHQTSPPSFTQRPRSEPQAKKGKALPKAPADPDQVFPCKKCGRVFNKVKSRSAHMKSHAEQEKKAAALRMKQQEEQARMRTLPRPGPRRPEDQGPGLYQEQDSGAETSEADDVEDEDWH